MLPATGEKWTPLLGAALSDWINEHYVGAQVKWKEEFIAAFRGHDKDTSFVVLQLTHPKFIQKNNIFHDAIYGTVFMRGNYWHITFDDLHVDPKYESKLSRMKARHDKTPGDPVTIEGTIAKVIVGGGNTTILLTFKLEDAALSERQ